MLIVAFLAGALSAPRWSPAMAWLGLSALLAFVAREPTVLWLRAARRGRPAGAARRIALVEGAGAALSGAVLLLAYGLWGLLPLFLAAGVLGAGHLALTLAGRDRTLAGEGVAILGVSLAAPAARHVAVGAWDPEAFWLWGLTFLYYGSSVFYIKLRVGTAHPGKGTDLRALRRRCALYHGTLLLALAAILVAGHLSWLAGLAFAAVLARAAWFLLRPVRRLDLRRLGYLEAAYSLAFLVLTVLAFRPA
jgi:hypothetical protein